MVGVNGVEIKAGQVWRTRSGEVVTVFVHDHNDTSYAWCARNADGDEIWLTNSGCAYESQIYPVDLIELVKGENGNTPADSATLAEETLSALGWTFDGQAWVEQPTIGMVPNALDSPVSAPALLTAAAKHMNDRAATYDKPEGERSMAQTVAVFEAYHGIKLTEAQGWHFMQVLKDVRLFTRDSYHGDSAEDCIAYAALKAEAKAKAKAKAQEGGA